MADPQNTPAPAEPISGDLHGRVSGLTGEKVALGPFVGKDMATLFVWRNDPQLSFANGPYVPTDEAVFMEWISGVKFGGRRVLFVIRNKHSQQLLGYVEIYNIDLPTRSAEFGIVIGNKSDRGKGFGLDATKLAVGYCWKELQLERVALRVIGENPAAVHVYTKAGFEIEGKLRRAAFTDGQFRDITVMGILRPRI